MPRFYMILGTVALVLFSYAQYRGTGLFDDVAGGRTRADRAGQSAYHK